MGSFLIHFIAAFFVGLAVLILLYPIFYFT